MHETCRDQRRIMENEYRLLTAFIYTATGNRVLRYRKRDENWQSGRKVETFLLDRIEFTNIRGEICRLLATIAQVSQDSVGQGNEHERNRRRIMDQRFSSTLSVSWIFLSFFLFFSRSRQSRSVDRADFRSSARVSVRRWISTRFYREGGEHLAGNGGSSRIGERAAR